MNDLRQQSLGKAERAVNAATRLLKDGDADFAASRAYYALLYATAALLNDDDIRVAEQLDLPGRVRDRLSRTRASDARLSDYLEKGRRLQLVADYNCGTMVSYDEARQLVEDARAIVAVAARQHQASEITRAAA